MEKSIVSMEQKLCKICGKTHGTNALLLQSRGINHPKLDKFTLTGYDYCKECKTKIDDGYIALVEISNTPTEGQSKLKLEEGNRTGNLCFIRKTAFEQIFNVSHKNDMMWIEIGVLDKLAQIQYE